MISLDYLTSIPHLVDLANLDEHSSKRPKYMEAYLNVCPDIDTPISKQNNSGEIEEFPSEFSCQESKKTSEDGTEGIMSMSTISTNTTNIEEVLYSPKFPAIQLQCIEENARPQLSSSEVVSNSTQDICPNKHWTAQEHAILVEGLKRPGSSTQIWKDISKQVGTKSHLQCKSHWQKFKSKSFKESVNKDMLQKARNHLSKELEEISSMGLQTHLTSLLYKKWGLYDVLTLSYMRTVVDKLFVDIDSQLRKAPKPKTKRNRKRKRKRKYTDQ